MRSRIFNAWIRNYNSLFTASLGGELASIGKDLEYTFSALIGNLGDRVGMLLQTLTTLVSNGQMIWLTGLPF
jgi:hypothetical protein